MKPLSIHLLIALALALLFTAGGCTTRYIREAQSHWNRAAEAENQLFAEGFEADNALIRQMGAVTDYEIALSLLERELDQNEERLRRDELYGTALLLKAMCLWRIADLEGLSESGENHEERFAATLREIRQDGSVTLGRRDTILMTALPGLRDHDRGLAAEEYERADAFFQSSLDTLDEAIAQTPEQHPIRAYLHLAQLSTCRAWQSAAYAEAERRGHSPADQAEFAAPATDRAKNILDALRAIAGPADQHLREQISAMAMRLGVE